MSTELDEALEWFARAEQAREVAGQLADPGARKAVLQLADNFDQLGRAAMAPTAGPKGRKMNYSAIWNLRPRAYVVRPQPDRVQIFVPCARARERREESTR